MTTNFLSHETLVRTALTVALLVLCGTLDANAQRLLIVSAGDSYASGEGAPDPQDWSGIWRGDNTDGDAATCHRSNRAAAADAARRLSGGWPVDFYSMACSGSQTGAGPFEVTHRLDGAGAILNGDKSLLGSSGQLAKISQYVTANPKYPVRTIDGLVLSIGGNDIGFDQIVKECMSVEDCRVEGSSYVAQRLAELPGRLHDVMTAVNNGAAGAVRHVFLVQYPDPTTGIGGWRCGAPGVGSPEGPFPTISEDEATWASTDIVAPLNAILANAVANDPPGGPVWHIVDGVVNQFLGHGYCNEPEYRYINTTADSLWLQHDIYGTMHPNAMGQSALANAITAAMQFLPPQSVFVSQSVPSTMLPGYTYPVSITMRNTGSVTWTAPNAYRLGSQAPQDNRTWGVQRVELPAAVAPGSVATFNFLVTAPTQPGSYTFQWRMVQDSVQWFGAFTPRVTVNVPNLNRQMSVQVVQNSITLTSANITAYATDVSSGAPVSASIMLNGAVVGQTGQPFTYTRVSTRVCENIDGQIICYRQFVDQEFSVVKTGYDSVSFVRF